MNSFQGQLLIASPNLADPNFARTVVLMIQHGKEGAMGLVLNRPTDTTVAEAWKQINTGDCAVEGMLYQGGPCEGPLMVLHASEPHGQMGVLRNLYFTTDREMIESLVVNHPALSMKFFVGYAGWGPDQLENEMEQGGWLILPATDEPVFTTAEDLWERLMGVVMKAGVMGQVPPDLIPDDPSVN